MGHNGNETGTLIVVCNDMIRRLLAICHLAAGRTDVTENGLLVLQVDIIDD